MKTYVVFSVSEISSIDFNQVLQSSIEDLFYSIDGTKTFVSWNVSSVPDCVIKLNSKSDYLQYVDMLSILNTSDWSTRPIPL
jgi:hypothetical protein